MKFLLFLFGCNSFTNYECVFIFNFTLQHFPAHGLHRVVRSSSMPKGMLQIMAEDVAKILTPPSTTASPPVGKSSSRYYKELRTLTLRIRTLQLGIRTLIIRNTNIVLFVRLVPSTSTKGRHMGQQVDLDQNQWSLWRTHHLKIANTKKEVSISLLTPPTHCFDCFVQYIFDITYFLFQPFPAHMEIVENSSKPRGGQLNTARGVPTIKKIHNTPVTSAPKNFIRYEYEP